MKLNINVRNLPTSFLVRLAYGVLGTALCLLAACASSPLAAPQAAEVDQALQRYAEASKAMDYAAVAATYTDDAEISHGDGTPVRTAAAIRTFLESFRDYKVRDYRLTSSSVKMSADGALQTGTYWQRVTLPDGLTVEAAGRFEAIWVRNAAGQWRLRKMATYSP